MEKIYVTKPDLPPIEEFLPYIKDIWKTRWLTNYGKYLFMFERKLKDFLKVKYCNIVVNGTLALILALKALELSGEVITTPFSFVATSHAIKWCGLKPVFCDIDENTFTIDPNKIEKLITKETSAILPVHIYGFPCHVKKIQKIANKYDLKIIYDAAQAFNVQINNKSILDYGDISILSFHATKVFNTFEGGAIITHNKKLVKKINLLKNFGFIDEDTVIGTGTNAKMNEFQAALGVLQLNYVEKYIKMRKKIIDIYLNELKNVKGIRIFYKNKNVGYNYTYFPILISKDEYGTSRDDLNLKFLLNNIYTRKYFHPLISKMPAYQALNSTNSENLPVAEKIEKQILCLPVYSDLHKNIIQKIINIIKKG